MPPSVPKSTWTPAPVVRNLYQWGANEDASTFSPRSSTSDEFGPRNVPPMDFHMRQNSHDTLGMNSNQTNRIMEVLESTGQSPFFGGTEEPISRHLTKFKQHFNLPAHLKPPIPPINISPHQSPPNSPFRPAYQSSASRQSQNAVPQPPSTTPTGCPYNPPLFRYGTLPVQIHRQNPHISLSLLSEFFHHYLPKYLLPLNVFLCLDTGYTGSGAAVAHDESMGFCLAVDSIGWQLIRAQLEYWLLNVDLMMNPTLARDLNSAFLNSQVWDIKGADSAGYETSPSGLRAERLMVIRNFTEWQQLCHGLGMRY